MIVITENDLMNARTYLPMHIKQAFLEHAAPLCFDTLNININENGLENVPFPAMYKENTFLKSRFLMGALWGLYFGKPYERAEGDDYMIPAELYDELTGSHILNQIERMKGRGEALRLIAFDLLADYRDLERRMNAEVYGMVNAMNDPCTRLYAMMFLQTTPEEIQRGAEQLKGLTEQLEELKAKRKERAVSDNAG
jgi:hypothetical protein